MSKQAVVFDIEIFADYFLVAFRNIATGNVAMFDMWPGQAFDVDQVRRILKAYTIVGFNSNNFDLPLLTMALNGADCEKIKKAANAIILNNLRSWQLEKRFNFKTISWADHIDLIEVAPGMASLKAYGGRMHCKKMQDLPIEPEASISLEDRVALRQYCGNDLELTEMLYRRLLPQIELRQKMGAEYELDLRSKSDAQIAEHVIRSQVEQIKGHQIERPVIEAGTAVRYNPPAYLAFKNPVLQDVLQRLIDEPFIVLDTGKVREPAWMKTLKITIGQSTYAMGLGGLHSTEKCVAHFADERTLLLDRDVASYYPNLILKMGLAPRHMGSAFTRVYRSIVERRLAAKASGDTVTNDALKITINGSFGKFGSKYSILYSPNLLIQTTITGQLALLMLIEWLEERGISVVSGNTDGVVIKCPVELQDALLDVFYEWETTTGLETEEKRYKALYSANVNNYIAVYEKGGAKTKGWYALGGLAKTPSNNICTEAVVTYLQHGTPIEDTINGCWDITKFVTVRAVKGGALDQDGAYLGKTIRWYYATDLDGVITYKVNGNAVPRSEGARALMDLPDEFPLDLDVDWYIAEAKSILNDIGATNAAV